MFSLFPKPHAPRFPALRPGSGGGRNSKKQERKKKKHILFVAAVLFSKNRVPNSLSAALGWVLSLPERLARTRGLRCNWGRQEGGVSQTGRCNLKKKGGSMEVEGRLG